MPNGRVHLGQNPRVVKSNQPRFANPKMESGKAVCYGRPLFSGAVRRTWQVPMDTLLYKIGGDTNKAVDAIKGALNRAGIRMTRGELNLLGIVAAEASAYQQAPSFQQDVAIEMLKQDSKEAAWTAASETLWQEATDRVIEHGVADFISSLDKGTNLHTGEIYRDNQAYEQNQSLWKHKRL